MKICLVASVFPRYDDDLEVPWFREMVRRCRDQGLDIRVFVPSYRGLRDHVIDGIPVYRFRYFFRRWETLTHDEGAPNKIHRFHYKFMVPLYVFFGTVAFIRLHCRERFDIIHVHWPVPHALFAIAARRFRPAKLILNFYLASIVLMKKYGWVRRFLSWFIGSADGIVAISNYTAGEIKAIRDCDVTIIPYGAMVRPRETIPVKRGEPDEKVILSVGRMIERKGFEYAIRAMPLVRAEWPRARLFLVGGGPWQDRLRALAGELRIEDAVVFTGKISSGEKEELFASCDLFVLPSVIDSKGDTEGLGVVLIEALMYRRPVVGTDIGGIPDIVIDNKTGLLVPQKDPRALAAAVCRILGDRELALRLADDGFAHVRDVFNWDSIAGKLIKVYQSLCP